ncbi:serine hydrolase domain-containing protein [Polaromonas sp.]|uniref:serine hydrolase domain-containing protein n=1 Tax=Polaromonas sp. TaxID=1869339 RepID=UPI003CBAACAA
MNTFPQHRFPGRFALVLATCAALAAPVWAEPDEDLLGKPQNYPLGTVSNWQRNPYRVGSWSALDKVPGIQTRQVARALQASPLPRAAQPPAISYRYRNIGYTLVEYLERQRATGLLVLKNGEIVAEHYRYGRKDDARFISFSMAKSVTSLLIGQAHARGLIASLDDVAEKYVQALAGSPYGATTIRQLLRMSSGLTFTERYDGKDDIARLSRATIGAPGAGTPADVLRSITDRHSPAGEKFVYAGAETDILGRVLSSATGKNVAELTSEWLWKPMGAEHDAFWRIGVDGQEQSYGAFNASLRDWARLGLLLANDGKVGSQQVLSLDYLLDATDATRQPPAFKPRKATPYFGYGYQFWLMPLKQRTFAMQGIHGQTVYVQPSTGLVLVLTSVWESASGRQDAQPYEERDALWRGVLQSLGGSTVE